MAQVASAEVHDIQLLKDEGGGLMMEDGITTITFYRGAFKPAAEALRAQFALVVAANPWLAGRLVKAKAGVHLRHPASPSAADIDSLFTATSANDTAAFKLRPTTPYTQICTDMYASKKVIVPSGSSILGKNQPVTILTVAESAPGEFALVFSVSHAVGDGRTYYEVLQMLQPGAAVRGLSTKRAMAFSEEMRDVCGRKELEWADTTSTACMYTFAMLPAMLGFGKKPRCVAFHLDANRLAEAKSAGAAPGSGVPYVTTNDILTSGFFKKCGSRIGMMGMDCRGRIKGIESDMAGNYVTALTMDPETFGSPAAVRRMLSSTPYETTAMPLPGCCAWTWGCAPGSANFAMATNWSSFAGGMVQLAGCELAIHLPVKNPAMCVFDLMIPFASGVGKVGVLCWTVSTDEKGLREALPVGECVSRELFP